MLRLIALGIVILFIVVTFFMVYFPLINKFEEKLKRSNNNGN